MHGNLDTTKNALPEAEEQTATSTANITTRYLEHPMTILTMALADAIAIAALCTRFGLNGAEGILTHWIAVSEVVQLLLSGVLLYLAGRKINPLK